MAVADEVRTLAVASHQRVRFEAQLVDWANGQPERASKWPSTLSLASSINWLMGPARLTCQSRPLL